VDEFFRLFGVTEFDPFGLTGCAVFLMQRSQSFLTESILSLIANEASRDLGILNGTKNG
jgi:hypothetical protein